MPIEEVVSESARDTMEARTSWGDLLRDPLPMLSDSVNSKNEVKKDERK